MQVPASLITTSWNLMKLDKDKAITNQIPPTSLAPPASSLPPNQNSASSQGSGQHVYMQHMKLQDKLLKVRIDPAISADGLSVENDYSKQVGDIEMDRYRALNSCPSDVVKSEINAYYDKQRLKLVECTENSLDKLIAKAEEMRKAVMKVNSERNNNLPKPVPQGKQLIPTVPKEVQGASLLLQPADDKDKMNAVRKLKFNTSEENAEDDDDYLNCSVNSEDFEIDEIDVETVDKDKNTQEKQEEIIHSKNERDILQECLKESGIGDLNHSLTSDQKPFTDTSLDISKTSSTDVLGNHSTLPDSTSSTDDSPISMGSVEDESHENLCMDNSNHGTNSLKYLDNRTVSPIHQDGPLNTKPFPQARLNFGSHLFSTPLSNSDLRFTNPATLSMALSEIQKLCGGPTVNFSPELRKEINQQSFTPETSKSSPLNKISNYNLAFTGNNRHPTDFNSASADAKDRQMPCNIKNFETALEKLTNGHNHHHSHYPSPPEQQQQQQTQEQQDSMDSQNNNVQLNDRKESQSVSTTSDGNSKADTFKFENTPVFRTHRMLTPESTEILNNWYHNNVQYPYPNDEQVRQLAEMTGITARQVKKWMANKRVRCFNTLSITGNQHPIKYKYQGQGRKRKVPFTEKENCDSTTAEKRPNYTMLNEQAKLILNQWYEEHVHNPYPTDEEKQELASKCNISISQVKSWFANKRNRTNNTKRQVPNYFIHKFPEYSHMVHMVGQKREEERMLKRRKVNEFMYIQPPFYL